MGLLRILWYSNAPWPGTGYGTQTAQVVRRLAAAGHEVAIANNYGFQAGDVTWEQGVPILGQGADSYSRDVVLGHAEAWNADWIITLYDVWIFQPREAYRGPRWASWVPVDSDPIPPEVLAWCQEHYSIAMSQFGQRQLITNGVPARYVPHAVERDVYRPTPSDARQKLGIPEDAFLVLINAANKGMPPRKAWPEMLMAHAEFAARHKDVYLYINTEPTGIYGGLPLPVLMTRLGIDPERVRLAPQYEYATNRISPRQVAALYTTADVLLATSMGEGFGLAVLEAQACGTPVIVTDFTAQPELLGAGWKVGYQRYYHPAQGTFWATPLVPEIVDALEASYEMRGDEVMRQSALDLAADYDADLVFQRDWTPVLAELEALARPPVKRQQRRAQARAQRKGRAA